MLATTALEASARHSVRIRRSSDEHLLDYSVVPGDVIQRDATPVYELYQSARLLRWIQWVTATPAAGLSPHVRSAVNINVLESPGQQYRWHHDAVPFTALLFLTSLPASAGGEFLIRTREDELMAIAPVAGQLVVIDGHRCPHAVAPLREHAVRLTVPMVFPAYDVERPLDLDDYLYSADRS